MNNEDASRLATLGWDAGWAAAFAAACESISGDQRDELSPGRVIAEHRDRYVIADAGGERAAVLAGRVRHDLTSREALPSVGDWVAVAGADVGSEDVRVIRAVVPRRSAFVRRAAGRGLLS